MKQSNKKLTQLICTSFGEYSDTPIAPEVQKQHFEHMVHHLRSKGFSNIEIRNYLMGEAVFRTYEYYDNFSFTENCRIIRDVISNEIKQKIK